MINIKVTSNGDDESMRGHVEIEAFGSDGVLINEFTVMLEAIESKPRACALFMLALANHIGDFQDD